VLSLGLVLWQWAAARGFPLHERRAGQPFPPAVSLLKPVKGCEPATEACFRSWFEQRYTGRVQILFGVATAEDPACAVIRKLIAEHSNIEAQLLICGPPIGANAKVSKLVELARLAKHEILVISDADVKAPPDLLASLVALLREPEAGLVNCFYRLANPAGPAMRWEAVAINADFWSQVLQSRSLKPLDFALGAVMAAPRKCLEKMGGFEALVDCLADDYQLGNRIARQGRRILLSPLVVECWSEPVGWKAVWSHQLRWARTIRVCQPLPYFFSILSNGTLWPLLWLAVHPAPFVAGACLAFWGVRIATCLQLKARLEQAPVRPLDFWLPLLKDLLQAALWVAAFLGNHVEWRGKRMRLRRDGTLERD
jgi:ceramide glucosyltransferase